MNALQTPRESVSFAPQISTPRIMNTPHIILDYEPEPLRVVKISEFIYSYMECESTQFLVPKWESKKNTIYTFNNILKVLDMTPDMDTRYMGGRHPKTRLTMPEHYLHIVPNGHARMRASKSLFSEGMIKWYQSQGIETSFFNNWRLVKTKQIEVESFVPTNIIHTIIEKCEEHAVKDQNIYKAYLLGYGIGLRNSEIKRAKWSDFYTDVEGNKLIRIWQPKGIKGAKADDFQDRPCDPTFWDRIMQLKDDNEFILDAAPNFMFRTFPKFLKEECGVKERRCVHLLRKYCGHRIMKTNGIYAASKALGHTDTKITDKIYSGLPTIQASKAG